MIRSQSIFGFSLIFYCLFFFVSGKFWCLHYETLGSRSQIIFWIESNWVRIFWKWKIFVSKFLGNRPHEMKSIQECTSEHAKNEIDKEFWLIIHIRLMIPFHPYSSLFVLIWLTFINLIVIIIKIMPTSWNIATPEHWSISQCGKEHYNSTFLELFYRRQIKDGSFTIVEYSTLYKPLIAFYLERSSFGSPSLHLHSTHPILI